MMPGNRAAQIRALFAAYLANDRQRVADALADDFRFTSPFDDGLDKAAYFERCWKDTGWIARHDIEMAKKRLKCAQRCSIKASKAILMHCGANSSPSFRLSCSASLSDAECKHQSHGDCTFRHCGT